MAKRGNTQKAVSGSGGYIIRSAEGRRSSVRYSRGAKASRDINEVIGIVKKSQKRQK